MKVLVFGNANADISIKPVDRIDPGVDTVFIDDFELSNGGNGMTAAVVLSRLGVECALATALGDDDDHFSRYLMDKMLEVGLDTSLVSRVPGLSCGCVIDMIQSSGKRWFFYKKGVQDIMTLEDCVLQRVKDFDIVSINGTFLMPKFDGDGTRQLLSRAKQEGKTTVMDLTPDTSGKWLKTIGPALKFCDYFMPSELEARGMTGENDPALMASSLINAGAKNVIIKLGERGCYYIHGSDKGYEPAFNISPIDTTGAGDSFCAGFIYGLTRGFPFHRALRVANAVGAVSCESLGPTEGIREIESIRAFLTRHNEQELL